MEFCVIRHPEAGIGTCPSTALEVHRAAGWIRVSEFRLDPNDFDLSDYVDAPDLDAPPPAPAQPEKPAKTIKES